MPLYDYECRNCGHIVEVLHGVNDTGPAACEVCGGQLKKLINPPAIVFKGSGWAKKDFRDSKKSAAKTSTKSSSADGDSSKSSSADSDSSKSSDSGSKSESNSDKPASKETSTAPESD